MTNDEVRWSQRRMVEPILIARPVKKALSGVKSPKSSR